MVRNGTCPVCRKTYGKKAPKATVMQHMRMCKEVEHVIFKAKRWAIVFAQGKFCNHPKDEREVIEKLRTCISATYGPDMIQKLVH